MENGKRQISPDSGNTWINVLTQDTIFQMYWISPKPTLTGSTNGWQSFDLDISAWAAGSFPFFITADTVLFRFTYITDSNSTLKDGWIIDDILVEDWLDGIEEIQNNNSISIYPNPVENNLTIHKQTIQIFNIEGQLLYENLNFIGETVNVHQLNNGVYLLKYSNTESYPIKKFIVFH